MIRVLIVDDHPLVREGLARLLAGHGIVVVGLAAEGEEGIRLARRERPDVVLWDLAMPGGGLGGLARLREAVPDSRILAVTALDDPWLGAEAARAGADGFLPKSSSPEELRTAILDCLQGRGPLPSPPALSPREEEVFRLLATGAPNPEIARSLGISIKTVESYLEGLKGKLGCRTTAELRARALRRGDSALPRSPR
ncbi:response regulator transcription factor [Candidatus Bipolaricaulota bacterium]|nr:response regulator transcription factor [Candidatus Bipolaricaulota bacterium]